MTTHLESLIGAYVVDALTDEERAQFEAHLETCADCQAELASLHETAALIAEPEAMEPPPSLRTNLLSAINEVRPLPPEEQADTDADSDSAEIAPVVSLAQRRSVRIFVSVAAAAAVVAVAAGVAGTMGGDDPRQTPTVTVAEQVLEDPQAEESLAKFGNTKVTVTRSDDVGRAVIVTTGMKAAPAEKVYQLWFQVPGEGMVSAGLMPEDPNQPVVLQGDATRADAVGITLEPSGGSEQPTSDPLAVVPFETDA